MSKLDKYLEEISSPTYEPKRDDIVQCTICGRKADVLNEGKGPLVCCGKPMIPIGEAVDRNPEGEFSMSEAEGMKGLPKGWTQSSLKRFSKSLTGKEGTQKGFFDKCVKKMQGKIDNPEGFCASAKDELHGSTMWRGKGKTPQQAGKDVKAFQNVKRG
jgi:desulfoferrodoxin-like iron-binding protein